MLRFNDIADRVLEYDPECDLALLQRAYVYTAKVHEGQERLSGEPYLIHPLEVAGILVELRLDAVTIVAGLLHDTVEDTLTTVDEIKRLFGEDVAFLVEGLTKISKVEFSSAQERQAENFRKMLVAMSRDIRTLLIKLADRLHNMRTLHFLSDQKAQRVAQETLDIYVPLSHRLGIHWMKRELEDLAFRVLHPEAVDELEQSLRGRHAEREEYIDEVNKTLEGRLREAHLKADISGRLKDLASIHAKMERQGTGLDKIYDVIAFRIVLEGETGDVYHALGLVHALWPPVSGRFKDYIALPKSNGYQSLHTTVIGPYGERMEIQLRTAAMHRSAELGIAAHWKYKDAGAVKDEAEFAWLRQLMERQGEVNDPDEFLDAVKVDLFPNECFVFTPQGDVISLPQGATALDFAYAVHSEVGDRCTGARVNGTQRPLSHPLRNGDTIEVQMQTNQAPKKDWLDFVVSSKARSRIRHAVRVAENESSRELGRTILDREFRKVSLSLPRVLEDRELDDLVQKQGRGNIDELLAAIGYGKLEPRDVIAAIRPELVDAPAPLPRPSTRQRIGEMFRREKRGSSTGIRVDGHGDVLVRFGQCCAPLPGDAIKGFVTRGRGVTVHARDCRAAFELDPERVIEVEWDSGGVARRVSIRVTSRDEPGLLADITRAISKSGINISSAAIDTHDDRTATQQFEVWVEDSQKLASVMKEIGRIKGVRSVERVRA